MTFSTNSGSVLSLNPSVRCGLSSNLRQIRPIVESDRPLRLAIDALDQPGNVVTRVEDDQDGRGPLAPVPGLRQPGDDIAYLGGGHVGLVIIWPRRIASSTTVQEARSGSSAAITEYGQPGIIFAWPLPRP